MAPFTGVQPGQGVAIARDRKSGRCTNVLLSDAGTAIVQANMDIWRSDLNDEDDDWQDICNSRYRRTFALAALSGDDCGTATMTDLWCLVSIPPCLAHDTVYTVSMVPATGELVTRVEVKSSHKRAGVQRWGHVSVSYSGSSGATRQ